MCEGECVCRLLVACDLHVSQHGCSSIWPSRPSQSERPWSLTCGLAQRARHQRHMQLSIPLPFFCRSKLCIGSWFRQVVHVFGVCEVSCRDRKVPPVSALSTAVRTLCATVAGCALRSLPAVAPIPCESRSRSHGIVAPSGRLWLHQPLVSRRPVPRTDAHRLGWVTLLHRVMHNHHERSFGTGWGALVGNDPRPTRSQMRCCEQRRC